MQCMFLYVKKINLYICTNHVSVSFYVNLNLLSKCHAVVYVVSHHHQLTSDLKRFILAVKRYQQAKYLTLFFIFWRTCVSWMPHKFSSHLATMKMRIGSFRVNLIGPMTLLVYRPEAQLDIYLWRAGFKKLTTNKQVVFPAGLITAQQSKWSSSWLKNSSGLFPAGKSWRSLGYESAIEEPFSWEKGGEKEREGKISENCCVGVPHMSYMSCHVLSRLVDFIAKLKF